MAGEVTYTGHGNLRVAAVLAQLIHENLVDQTDLRGTARYYGSVTGKGSSVLKVGGVSFDDAMAAGNTDEVTAAASTDLGDSAASITIARQVLVRTISDMFTLTDGPSLERLAQDMANAARLRFTDLVCGQFTGLSASAGTAGVALTVDDIYDAMNTLRSGGSVTGQFFLVLSHTQYGNFVESLRGEGQAIHPPESAEMLALRPAGLQGSWNGIFIFASDSVSGEIGALYDSAAFGWADGVPDMSNPAKVAAPVDGSVIVEFDRDAAAGHDIVVGSWFVGVQTIEAARAVKILSGA